MTMAYKRTEEVFGMSNTILPDSYVDRGHLDAELARHLGRSTHVALRGVSKCGKSWLRQRILPTALVVQCRHQRTVADLYVDALSQLGIRLEVESKDGRALKFVANAEGEIAIKHIAKAKLGLGAMYENDHSTTTAPLGRTAGDLSFVADIIKASGRRLVIEDFHYLSTNERRLFAFELKALWDYGLFVTVVGVWGETNLLLTLNPDMSGRVEELSISWSKDDLEKILVKGALRSTSCSLRPRAASSSIFRAKMPACCRSLPCGLSTNSRLRLPPRSRWSSRARMLSRLRRCHPNVLLTLHRRAA